MSLVHYRVSRSLHDAQAAYPIISDLTDSYPGFRRWYFGKAVPDIVSGSGSLILAEQDGEIVGLAIGKKTAAETKLRCLRVVPRWRQRGLGMHLADRILTELDCDKPLCTVPQDLIHDYARPFVNRYGFHLTEVAKGMYHQGRLEYIFNGTDPEPPSR